MKLMYLAVLSIVFVGCAMQVQEPWTCECDCLTSRFECTGATISSELQP